MSLTCDNVRIDQSISQWSTALQDKLKDPKAREALGKNGLVVPAAGLDVLVTRSIELSDAQGNDTKTGDAARATKTSIGLGIEVTKELEDMAKSCGESVQKFVTGRLEPRLMEAVENAVKNQ